MVKVTFMGAGSSAFAKKVLGDVMITPSLSKCEIALYDIDKDRLAESELFLTEVNKKYNESRAVIKTYHGVENRKEALRGADFVVNAINVGRYDPSTKIDFAIPKKYGIEQTIGDTIGIGGIFRALRTIPVLKEFAEDIEEVCPNAWFLNYTNPMAMLSGYMQRFTNVKMVGLCHSVQVCSETLLNSLDMMPEGGFIDKIAGINHMAWLLEITDMNGNDLYPEIRRRAAEKNATMKHTDMVRFEYIRRFGYYCTESSEHNAEYNPYFIKPNYPELVDKFNVPIDEYPRRCLKQIADWGRLKEEILNGGDIIHERSVEYAPRIIESVVTNTPYKIGANVLNKGLITNLPSKACVEVPCLVDGSGITPTVVGELPTQLAALNQTNINVQLMTVEAAVSRRREDVYMAAMLDPRCAAQLSMDDIVKMCDELIEAHAASGFPVL